MNKLYKKVQISEWLLVIFLIAISLPALISLLKPGLPPTHDGEYHVIRFYEFYRSLQTGIIYPRWAFDLNKGYGLPLFNYVYPFPNYIAAILHSIGLSFIDSFKINMFLASIVGTIFFYLFSKQFWGRLGGFVSSVLYTYAPYHLLDIYVRGSVGEVWALAFFPAVLYFFIKGLRKDNAIFFVLSGLFLSLIIFSHNILGLMFFIFFAVFIFFSLVTIYKKRKFFFLSMLSIAEGLSLSAIFWVPALLEKNFVNGLLIYNIEKNFVELYELIIPSWGTGFDKTQLGNYMSLQIGIANLISVLLVCVLIFFKRNKQNRSICLFFLSWFLFLVFLMLPVSLPVWKIMPLMENFQFPWRLLSLVILIASFLAGSIFYLVSLKEKTSFILAACVVFFSIFLSRDYSSPAFYHQRDDNYYIQRRNFISGTNSPGDLFNTIWMSRNISENKTLVTVPEESIKVSIEKKIKDYYSLTSSSQNSYNIVFSIAYFPSWKAYVDKKQVSLGYSKDGLITIKIPSGNHKVVLLLNETYVQKLSGSYSLLVFICVVIYMLRRIPDIIKR